MKIQVSQFLSRLWVCFCGRRFIFLSKSLHTLVLHRCASCTVNCSHLLWRVQNLLHRQRKSVQDRKERYDNGLLKLADTEEQVAQMQIDLEELQPKLKEATIATDALLVQIAKDTEVANEKKAVVEKEASSQRKSSRPHSLSVCFLS